MNSMATTIDEKPNSLHLRPRVLGQSHSQSPQRQPLSHFSHEPISHSHGRRRCSPAAPSRTNPSTSSPPTAPRPPAAASASASVRSSSPNTSTARTSSPRKPPTNSASPKTTAGPAISPPPSPASPPPTSGRDLKTGNVRTYPWQRDEEISYQVTLDIRQLHGESDGYAVIEAGWRVYPCPTGGSKPPEPSPTAKRSESDGYNASVAAQSRLIGRLSDTIAASIR